MKKQDEKLKKISWICFFIFLFVLAIVSSFNSCKFMADKIAGNFSYPYLQVGSKFANSVINDSYYLGKSKSELIKEIENLKTKNQLLASQVLLINELERQNNSLRNQKNLPPHDKFTYCYGEIILRDPVNWFESFTINRGGLDGIKKGSAVFTLDNNSNPLLLGVVEEVFDHSSKVLSISSFNLKISGRLSISQNVGLINFNENRYRLNNQYVAIDLLPSNDEYVIDEEVFTTGLEENIPPGIRIGNLSTIHKDNSIFSNELYISGLVSIKNNLGNIRFVTIAIKNTF